MKTNELTGAALDWAVARAEGAYAPSIHTDADGTCFVNYGGMFPEWSTNWAHGGPIVERELINTYPRFTAGRTEGGSDVYLQDGWAAYVTPRAFWVTPRPFTGPTPLIAAMRCYVASKLGDTVDVPEQLTKN